MKITRLGWAGIELQASSGETAVIDLLQNTDGMARFMGEPHTALPAPTRSGAAVLALVTHLHQDHADGDAIAAALAPGGVLLRPAPDAGEFLEIAGQQPAEERLRALELPQRHVAAWETVDVGPFRATAVPAVDGFGDPQVSWVVEADGTRIYHGGDTLYHGWWWRARMRTGDVDYAFLPANGPLVDLPHRRPGSPRNAVMSPAEAAAAAYVLGARVAIPIHYDTIHHPPIYVQADDPAGTFVREAEALGVTARVVAPGEVVTEDAPAPA
ncbi:MAG TPA: MBL fold metallo-hydrolase [Baekduia sp.]|nr:MBL fold metallo-hydrolase [Baekduia sp.]